MDTSLKRIIAYVLDILLVTIVVTLLANLSFLNPYKDEYDKTYDRYLELVEVNNAEYFDDENQQEEAIALNYELYKYKVFSSSLSLGALLIYFGVLQYVCHGQTIGKKIMKVKVVSNKDKKLNIGQYLLRIIILNNMIFTIIAMICVYFCKELTFYYLTYVLSLLQNAVYLVNILMVVLRKDGRGIHDMISGTKVIDVENEISVQDILEEKNETIKEKSLKVENKRSKKAKTSSKK